MITQSIKLSAKAYKSAPIISMMQSDTGRTLQCTFDDFEIPEGATASLYIHRPNETYYEQTASISGQTITIDADQIITTAGYVNCNLKIEKNGEMIQSFPFTIRAVSTSAGSPQTEENGTTVGELADEVDALSTAVAGKLDKETVTTDEIVLKSRADDEMADEGTLSLNHSTVSLSSRDDMSPGQSSLELGGHSVNIKSNGYPSYQDAVVHLDNDNFFVKNYEIDELTYQTTPHTLKFQDGELTIDNNPITSDTAWGQITGTLSDQTDLQSALDDKLGLTTTTNDPVSITSANSITLDVTGASGITMTDSVQISGYDGIDLAPNNGTATINDEVIATRNWAKSKCVEEQNWQLLDTVTSDAVGLTYDFTNQSEVAYKDVYVRMTLPAGSSWNTYPNLKLLYRNNDTDTTISQFTMDLKNDATTATQYGFVYSEAKGNARETFNGFIFANNNSYVTARMNPYSATDDGKPWFRLINSNNYINKFTATVLPAGTVYEFYVARPVTL